MTFYEHTLKVMTPCEAVTFFIGVNGRSAAATRLYPSSQTYLTEAPSAQAAWLPIGASTFGCGAPGVTPKGDEPLKDKTFKGDASQSGHTSIKDYIR